MSLALDSGSLDPGGAAASPLRRMLALARPLRATLLVAVVSGVLGVGCGVALLGVSGYLIARASEHPNEAALAVAVVGVRAFGIGRGILLLAIALHITATVQLALRSKAARPVGYSRQQAINSSYASRTMYWSGPIVLAFVIFHLLNLTAGYYHPGAAFIDADVYHNVVTGFQVWWVSVWYIFSMILLGLHLRHGIWSMFQSLGMNHPRHTPILKSAAWVVALVIVLGYISIPISVMLGVVK